MTLPTLTVPKLATDPGVLFWAPLGTAIPANTVTGSVFSDSWPVAWLTLGMTEEGHNFNFQTSTETVEFAELLDPAKYVTTGRTGSIAFALGLLSATNMKRALNGGTLTTAGTGATTMTTYEPPKMGQEIRAMVGWESQDSTERLFCYQVFNTGQVSIARRKGAAKATLPVEFGLEVPSSGIPFTYVTAGAERA